MEKDSNITWEDAHATLKNNWKLTSLFDDFFSSPISNYLQKFIKPSKRIIEILEKEEAVVKNHYDPTKGESVPEYILYYIYRPSVILASDQKEKLEIICQYLKNLGKKCGVTSFLPFGYYFNDISKSSNSGQNSYLKYFENPKETVGVEDKWKSYSFNYFSIVMGIPDENYSLISKDREEFINNFIKKLNLEPRNQK